MTFLDIVSAVGTIAPYLTKPWVLGMLIIDVFFQYTIVSLIYRELPQRNEFTVTKRLSRWKHTDPESLRGRWSINLCKFLNLFTLTTSPHC